MKILEKLFIILLLNLESLFEHFRIIDFLPKNMNLAKQRTCVIFNL